MDQLELRKWVIEKYQDQKRKQGTPAYEHAFGVAEILKHKGYSQELQIMGLLHDLREDCGVSYEELVKQFGVRIASAVNLVTKEPGYVQEEYIKRIKESKDAKPVKLADRLYNMNDSVYAPISFRKDYIKETKEYYLGLAKETIFEEDLRKAIEEVKQSIVRDERDESKNSVLYIGM